MKMFTPKKSAIESVQKAASVGQDQKKSEEMADPPISKSISNPVVPYSRPKALEQNSSQHWP